MAKVQSVWGIDLGRCALKAIKLRSGAEGAVEVVGQDFVEHSSILSQPDIDRPAIIASSLEKFLSKNDLSKDQVVVSVPGQHTLARFTKLPPVAPKRVPDIVKYEADQQIPFDMDEVIWDYQTFQQEGLPDIEVGIFAMKRELLREHLLHFEQAGVELIVVQSGPLAVYNTAYFEDLLGDKTTILLDVGAENSDLIVATDNSLWTRTIPIGGNSFTEALVKAFKLAFSKAESLKRAAETSKYRRQIFQAMRPVLADLVQELQRSIGFYSSTHRDAHFDRIVGYGNAFRLPGLQKYLQQNLGMDVLVPSSFEKAGGFQGGPFGDEFCAFAQSFGLALQGLDRAKVTSNLLPTEIAKQVVWRKKRPAFAAAAACLFLSGGTIWFRQTADMGALALAGDLPPQASVERALDIIDDGPSPSLSERAQAEAIKGAGKALKSEVGRLRGQGVHERADTEKLVELQNNKLLVPTILNVVHDALPVPEGILSAASTAEELREAANRGELPPRNQRKQVWIDSLDLQYEEDLHALDLSDSEMEPPINDLEAELPGLLLKLICTTPFTMPNQDAAQFITESFLTPLKKSGRRPGMGFYFDRVVIFRGEKVPIKTSSSRRGGRGARGVSGSGDGIGESVDAWDLVTDEPRQDDWRFEVYVDVVLEDYPEEAEDGGDENDA